MAMKKGNCFQLMTIIHGYLVCTRCSVARLLGRAYSKTTCLNVVLKLTLERSKLYALTGQVHRDWYFFSNVKRLFVESTSKENHEYNTLLFREALLDNIFSQTAIWVE